MIAPEHVVPSLKKAVKYTVMVLAILMTLVIFWGTLDVVIMLYEQLMAEPFMRLGSEHLLSVFGAFLAVLIAIEIFLNIILYLEENMFHVKLVVATALTAIVRKVIVLDYSTTAPSLICAIAAVVFAVGATYWITTQKGSDKL